MTVEFATALAPEMDRIRIAISRAITSRVGPLVEKYGLAPSSGAVFGNLRNLASGRRVSHDAVMELFVYQPPASTNAALEALARAGLVATEDGIGLTALGVAAVEDLFEISIEIVESAWQTTTVDFDELLGITGRVMTEADRTGGAAYSVMAPVYEPVGLPTATRFAETLTPLRFHRFDAHIAAWRAEGLTVEEVQALEDGSLRDAIEAETNARAALPYAGLNNADRASLLDGLRVLPAP